MKKKFLFLLLTAAAPWVGLAQKADYKAQARAYIERFKDLAIEEQKRTGVPASIKLAQGIFETGAGSSELCNNASNHFGIKCKSNWSGDTYAYTDDAKDECFRKYASPLHSYKDHSDFLRNNKRYSSLFILPPTNYAAWAKGLKRCGYATNPAYAQQLIKTIEEFNLQEYTYAALSAPSAQQGDVLLASAQDKRLPKDKNAHTIYSREQASDLPAIKDEEDEDGPEIEVTKEAPGRRDADKGVKDFYVTTTKNGKKGFYARKGDMLLEYAIKNKIRYAKILEMNDLPDAPLEADMFVYLERKSKIGSKPTHKVAQGETLLQISQDNGVQLQQLRAFNYLSANEEPALGSLLYLREEAPSKPDIASARQTAPKAPNRAVATSPTSYVYTQPKERREPPAELTETRPAARATTSAPSDATTALPRKTRQNEDTYEASIETRPAGRYTNNKTESANQTVAKPKEASPLDKLKAHMDKTVYGSDGAFRPKSTLQYNEGDREEDTDESEAELPPLRKVNTVVRGNSEPAGRTAQTAQAARTPAAATKGAAVHTVRKGDTLFSIAEKYKTTVAQIQKLNKLGSGKKIVPGMKLKVK